MSRVIDLQQEQYIRDNYLEKTAREIGEILGVPKATIQSAKARMGLTIPKELANARRASAQAALRSRPQAFDDLIRSEYLVTNVNQLSIKVGRSETYIKSRLRALGLVIPPEIIAQRKIDSRIKKGSVPSNKGKKQTEYMSAEQIQKSVGTRFKTGLRVHNELHDGAIVCRLDRITRPGARFHKWIRLAKGKWLQLQIYNWQQVNGPVPKGHCLWCINGDTLDCDPDNWELITRRENLKRNNGHETLPDSRVAAYIVGRHGKDLKDAVLQNADLIAIKRLSLQLNRQIKHALKSQTGEASANHAQ